MRIIKRIIVLIIAITLCGVVAIVMTNNLTAKKIADRLADMPLPEQTEYVESSHLAGKLVGNGNGMQYFGAILIKSQLPFESLCKFYDRYDIVVDRQPQKEIQIIEHKHLSFQTDIESDDYYIVYSWGKRNGFFYEFDLRGH